MNVTRRTRIPTGLICNIRCPFCYYGDELNTQSYSTEQIKRMIDLAGNYGIQYVDFSGGEPTTRSDLPELLSYAAKTMRQVCIISNGLKLADKDYLKSLSDAGLNEVLLSIHGATEESSMRMSGRRGFLPKVIQSLENISNAGLRLRTNTVITRYNADSLMAIAALVAQYCPAAVNFICFNDWVNAKGQTSLLAVRYSEVMPTVRHAVEFLRKTVSKVTVRYAPFCLLKGLEPHVSGLLQNTFDEDEWLDSIKRAIVDIDRPENCRKYVEDVYDVWSGTAWETLIRGLENEEVDAISDTPTSNLALHVLENFRIRQGYRKAACCKQCALDAICDGLHASYADKFGISELNAYEGDPITRSMHFRRK